MAQASSSTAKAMLNVRVVEVALRHTSTGHSSPNEKGADGVDGVCTKRRILRHTAEVIFCQERSPIMEVTTIGLDLG
ncbi:hypothetical protein, partial [Tritonibacter multivorans]|uniref:hypothetical protein n=1 Tax=Tritonibacter multivorans TaxID=928856 RepID=UPI002300C344